MASELEQARDHARKMAGRTKPRASHHCRGGLHDRCRGIIRLGAGSCECPCHPGAPAISEADRRLWTQLADEIDQHLQVTALANEVLDPLILGQGDEGPGLFTEEGDPA